jgi:hypothetical protein
MKKSLILTLVFTLSVVCLYAQSGKNQLPEGYWEFMQTQMEQYCKFNVDALLPEDVRKEMKSNKIDDDCLCAVFADVYIKLIKTKDLDKSSMTDILQIIQDMLDENSVVYNEFSAAFLSELEKKCMTSSSSVVVKSGPVSAFVPLVKQGDMYKIKVTLGKSSKYYLLDSGAASSMISKAYARELEDMNIIKADSYIDPSYYQMADGSTVLCRRVVLNNVKVENFILDKVVVAITEGDVAFLFGKDILNAFHSWKINNSNSTMELVK